MNVCEPSPSDGVVYGEGQVAKAPVSSLHSKCAVASSLAKVNAGRRFVIVPDGPEVSVVSGGTAGHSREIVLR